MLVHTSRVHGWCFWHPRTQAVNTGSVDRRPCSWSVFMVVMNVSLQYGPNICWVEMVLIRVQIWFACLMHLLTVWYRVPASQGWHKGPADPSLGRQCAAVKRQGFHAGQVVKGDCPVYSCKYVRFVSYLFIHCIGYRRQRVVKAQRPFPRELVVWLPWLKRQGHEVKRIKEDFSCRCVYSCKYVRLLSCVVICICTSIFEGFLVNRF